MLCENNIGSGNSASWEQTYAENFSTLCQQATRKLTNGNSFQAEDAVSEAFMRIMRYVPDSQRIQNPVSYWWTTIRRIWIAQQKRSEVKRTLYLEDIEADVLEAEPALRVQPDVLKALEKEEAQRDLRIKLGPLSLEERILIKGRLEGYSFQAIAKQLGENVKLTRFRWHKLKARQRYRFNKEKARTQSFGNDQ